MELKENEKHTFMFFGQYMDSCEGKSFIKISLTFFDDKGNSIDIPKDDLCGCVNDKPKTITPLHHSLLRVGDELLLYLDKDCNDLAVLNKIN